VRVCAGAPLFGAASSGMPSNHAQFMYFFATYASLVLFVK
jgi:hypothetical protein